MSTCADKGTCSSPRLSCIEVRCSWGAGLLFPKTVNFPSVLWLGKLIDRYDIDRMRKNKQRGSSLASSFNQWHVLAISQAICDYRNAQGIDGPLFIGADSHALSQPALDTALEVLAANGVQTMISAGGEFTPTPAISHAILVHNRGRSTGLADGIVITPSHNPPDSGGFKYSPCNGGPADSDITNWVQNRANALLEDGLKEVKCMPLAQARQAASTHAHDYLEAYVGDLGSVIDFAVIRAAGLRMGVDPLGGAGVDRKSTRLN